MTQQTVRLLIQPPLSWTTRMTKIAGGSKVLVYLLVIEKFLTLIVGNTFEKSLRNTGKQLLKGCGYILTCPPCTISGHEKAAFPFNRCQNKTTAILPMHQIAFPVPVTIINRA